MPFYSNNYILNKIFTSSGLNTTQSFSTETILNSIFDEENSALKINAIWPELTETPSTPDAGYRKLYAKDDGFYQLDSTGTESAVGGGSGTSGIAVTVQTDNVNVTPTRTKLNFLSGLTASDNSSNGSTDIKIQVHHVVEDEVGVFDAAGNLIGSNILITDLGQGHTIENSGTPLTNRTNLNFYSGLVASDDATNDATNIKFQQTNVSADEIAIFDNAGNIIGSQLFTGDYERHYNGVDDKSKFTITYDETTRKITVVIAEGAIIWVNNKKYALEAGSIEMTAHADTTGIYYLYYYHGDTSLTVTTDRWDLLLDCPLAYVYYNATTSKGILFDERHGTNMSDMTHKYLHNTRGTQVRSGFAVSGYTLNTSGTDENTYAVDTGVIEDEDLETVISALADGGPYTLWYRTGADADSEWSWDLTPTVPHLADSGTIAYNELTGGNWQQTALTSNFNWVNYWLCAVPSLTENQNIIIIQGQTLHTSSFSASNESIITNLSWGNAMPFLEIAPLYKITHRRISGSTPNNSQISSVTKIMGTPLSISSNYSPTEHNTLSGRSDFDVHPTSALSNDSTISGLTLNNVLETLQYEIDNISPSVSVNSDDVTNLSLVSGLNVTGALNSLYTNRAYKTREVVAVTNGVASPLYLDSTYRDKIITNVGASADTYVVMESASAGNKYNFYVATSGLAMYIKASSGLGDYITVDGGTGSSGGYLVTSAQYSDFTLEAKDADRYVFRGYCPSYSLT